MGPNWYSRDWITMWEWTPVCTVRVVQYYSNTSFPDGRTAHFRARLRVTLVTPKSILYGGLILAGGAYLSVSHTRNKGGAIFVCADRRRGAIARRVAVVSVLGIAP